MRRGQDRIRPRGQPPWGCGQPGAPATGRLSASEAIRERRAGTAVGPRQRPPAPALSHARGSGVIASPESTFRRARETSADPGTSVEKVVEQRDHRADHGCAEEPPPPAIATTGRHRARLGQLPRHYPRARQISPRQRGPQPRPRPGLIDHAISPLAASASESSKPASTHVWPKT